MSIDFLFACELSGEMKWFAIVTVLLVSQVVRGQSFGVGDIVQSAKDAVTGVAAKIPDAIPSAEDMFQSAKNLIAGYPFDAAFSAINLFCKFIMRIFWFLRKCSARMGSSGDSRRISYKLLHFHWFCVAFS